MMKYLGKFEYYWMLLIVITLFNTFLGERFSLVSVVSVLIAFTVMYKGFVIIDHFMELKEGNKFLRMIMRAYFIIFPSLIIVSIFF